jgi:hypothetical protein
MSRMVPLIKPLRVGKAPNPQRDSSIWTACRARKEKIVKTLVNEKNLKPITSGKRNLPGVDLDSAMADSYPPVRFL